jgi:hypothetical protein
MSKVPDQKGRTLVLTEAQWLALAHHAMGDGDLRNNCPFIYSNLHDVLEAMIGKGNDAPDIQDGEAYRKWYAEREECQGGCGRYFLKLQLVDGECVECQKEHEEDE